MENLKLLSKIALSFQNLQDFDLGMNEILEDIGRFIDISRIYIFLNENENIVSNAFEWCNEGIEPQMLNLQNVHYEYIPFFKKMLKEDGCICTDNIMNLPKDIIDGLKPQQIKSIIVYPLLIKNIMIGFIGFDECRYIRKWTEKELEILNTVSRLLGSAYERKFFQEELTLSENNFRTFFETIDDMFIVTSLDGKIVHCNRALIDKIQYPLSDLRNMHVLDLHPSNKRIEASFIFERMIKGELESCSLEIENRFGEVYFVDTRIWLGKWNQEDCIFSISKDISQIKEAEKALKENEKRFFLALDTTKAGLWDYDFENKCLFISPMWKKILGYEDEEIENSVEAVRKLLHPEDIEFVKRTVDEYFYGESGNYEVTIRIRHKDGSWKWILTRGGIFRDDKGEPSRWIGTSIDVSLEREQSFELERFFSVNLDLLLISNLQGELLKTNKAWLDVLGYSPERIKGNNLLDLIHPDDIAKTIDVVEELKRGNKVAQLINRCIDAQGNYKYIEWRANPYGSSIYASGRDITDRIEYEEKILELSNRDSLLGIYNRRYVYNRAKEIIEEYKRIEKIFSVCIIDIDNFKEINDTFGHQVGDSVLKEFSKILDENLRLYDILGRYGGEEFIIVLNNIDERKARLVINRILNIVREKIFIFEGNKVSLTFSAGIVSCKEVDKDEITIDSLVKLADDRMYHAKNTGRNKVVLKFA